MAVPEIVADKGIRLCLRRPETFAEDLGDFGLSVGPQRNAVASARRSAREIEEADGCLRRLLIAWKRVGCLAWPCEVRADVSARGTEASPTFVLHSGDSRSVLGVEVTKAATSPHRRVLDSDTRTVEGTVTYLGGDDGGDGQSSEQQAVEAVFAALEKDVARLGEGRDAAVPHYDLILHLESQMNRPGRPANLVRRLRADARAALYRTRNDGLGHVHILFDDKVGLDIFGEKGRLISIETAYEYDFVRWLDEEAKLAELGCRDELDLVNLAEELRSLGANERRARDSHLRNLLLHMLKWEFQPDKRSGSWASSMINARGEIDSLIRQSPSLGREDALQNALHDQFPRARRMAAVETGRALQDLPETCPYTLDQIFDPDFPAALDS